jgi:hypothetical protein
MGVLAGVVDSGNGVVDCSSDVDSGWVEVLIVDRSQVEVLTPMGEIAGRTAASDAADHKERRTGTARHRGVIVLVVEATKPIANTGQKFMSNVAGDAERSYTYISHHEYTRRNIRRRNHLHSHTLDRTWSVF